MSVSGTWKCPNCGKEWTGAVAWEPTKPEFEQWLVFRCGCKVLTSGRVERCR